MNVRSTFSPSLHSQPPNLHLLENAVNSSCLETREVYCLHLKYGNFVKLILKLTHSIWFSLVPFFHIKMLPL